MFGFGKKEELFAPCEGRCIPLKEVHDPVFSGGMMGEGVAIIPAIGELVLKYYSILELIQ